MSKPDAANAGEFLLGGEAPIHRLGFGAMRVTGEGIWGEPADREECLRVLRRLPELGVNFIDTADSYGPEVSEQLIREALHPYKGLTIATKAGQTRPGPREWIPLGRPEYLTWTPPVLQVKRAAYRERLQSYIRPVDGTVVTHLASMVCADGAPSE